MDLIFQRKVKRPMVPRLGTGAAQKRSPKKHESPADRHKANQPGLTADRRPSRRLWQQEADRSTLRRRQGIASRDCRGINPTACGSEVLLTG
jgi:hypothetical protein